MTTVASGKGLTIFLKHPGNPAALTSDIQLLVLDHLIMPTMTAADPIAKTLPTTAAVA